MLPLGDRGGGVAAGALADAVWLVVPASSGKAPTVHNSLGSGASSRERLSTSPTAGS